MKKMNLKLRGKLVVSVSVLIFLTAVIMSLVSYFSLSNAYDRTVQAVREKLDQMVQSQVECMVGVLQTNYDRYMNGEISEAKAKRGFVMKFEPYGWYIGTGNYEDDMLPLIQAELDASNRARTISILILCLFCVGVWGIGVFVISVIAGKIANPIQKASIRLQRLSEGNLHDMVEVTQTSDEVGILTHSLSKTVDVLSQYIENISYVLSELEKGNLDTQITLEYIGDFVPIKNSFVKTTAALNTTFYQINQSAAASKNTAMLIENSVKIVQEGTCVVNDTAQSLDKIIGASLESSQLIYQISEATQEQAQSLTQVKQGIYQISAVVQTNSATAEESAAASAELAKQAHILKNLVDQFHFSQEEWENSSLT